jgi:hypothetical protein
MACVFGGVDRIIELYTWRAGTAEMTGQVDKLTWGAWFEIFWHHAKLNFSIPAIVLAIAGVVALIVRRVMAYEKSRAARHPVPLIQGSPQLLLLFMPAAFQLLILRGTLIKHQHWMLPLTPLMAFAGALCLKAIWDLLRKVGRATAALAAAVVFVLVAFYCVQGANYYYDIRWQCDGKIALWKELNRLIPPDKKLVTFDAAMDGLMVTQSQAKGQVVRAEPAWYIDRPIESVPSAKVYDALRGFVADYQKTMARVTEEYYAGRLTEKAASDLQREAEGLLQMRVQAQAESDANKATLALYKGRSEAPVYLLPCLDEAYYSPLLVLYFQTFKRWLDNRFEMVYHASAEQGETRSGEFFRAGMGEYRVYDLRKPIGGKWFQPPAAASAPASRPGSSAPATAPRP